MQGGDGQGLYLYGVAAAESRPQSGLHSRGVQAVKAVDYLVLDGLAAIVSTVTTEEFRPERVEERLRAGETRWVEEGALAHAAVLAEAMRHGSVVPVRFGVLFRDADRLRAALAAHEAELREALGRLAGKAEWGVKGYYLAAALRDAFLRTDPELAAQHSHLMEMPPGQAYLEARRLERHLEARASERLVEAVRQFHEALAGASVDAELLEIRGQETTGREDAMVYHGAYLVRAGATERFQEALERTAEGWAPWGLHFELSGPWPPYHFARLSLDGVPA